MDVPSSPSVGLTVVIPAHNAAGVLPAQLDALMRQELDEGWEVVVVDNASIDGTRQLAERYASVYPRVRVVSATAAANASYARNAGARAARGDRLLFVDADDVVGVGWLAAMVEALEGQDFVAGPLEYAQLNPDWAVQVRGAAQRDGFFYVEGGPPWPLVFAANMGVTKALHDGVGGFDETFPWGGEDADYAWRLQERGAVPVWVSGAVVHYRLRLQLRPMFHQAVGYARSRWELHQRYAHAWPVPPQHLSKTQLVLRSVLHLRRARTRAGLAGWLWQVGWALGDREGARRNAPPPAASGDDRSSSGLV